MIKKSAQFITAILMVISLSLTITPIYNTSAQNTDGDMEEYEETPVTGVTVTPTNQTINVGNTFTITPTVTPDNATDYCVVNYDGVEGVFYCVGGHISFVPANENCRIFDEVSRFVPKKDV